MKTQKPNFIGALLLSVAFVIFGFASETFPQCGVDSTLSNSETTDRILKSARQAMEKSEKIGNIQGWSSFWQTQEAMSDDVRASSEIQESIQLPNRFKKVTSRNYGTNIIVSTSILDGSVGKTTSENFVNGVPLQLETEPRKFDTKKTAMRLARTLSFELLPILLDTAPGSYYTFEYIGKAQSDSGKAYILKATGKTGETYQLFFDQSLCRLLMMTSERSVKIPPRQPGNEKAIQSIKRNTFFSDYKEADGLVIAHRIVIEENGKTIYEQTLKKFEVNPKFKTNTFKVD
ncbi:MAG: hypothetical protein ACK5NT_06945 [Pyrinomonadaceae bacterium]